MTVPTIQRVMLRKISTRTVYGTVAAVRKAVATLPTPNDTAKLYDLFGICRQIIHGETDKGMWQALVGSFEAMSHNPERSGILYFAGRAFVPGPAMTLIEGQFGADVNEVQFGFTICAVNDDASVTGFIYTAAPLLLPQADDPMERLRRRLTHTPLVLAQASAPPEETAQKEKVRK